jgi:peptidylprolyl isomerase
MKLRHLFVGLAFLGATSAFGQSYTPAAGETVLKMEIGQRGTLFIRLYTREAPKITSRIVQLTESEFYDGLRFHNVNRTPKPYLVQFGAPSSKSGDINDPDLMKEGSGRSVPFEETGYSHDGEGVVGLSLQPGDRNSGDSQFYIMLAPAKFLDKSYPVFGRVVSGLDVLRKIELGDRVIKASILRG